MNSQFCVMFKHLSSFMVASSWWQLIRAPQCKEVEALCGKGPQNSTARRAGRSTQHFVGLKLQWFQAPQDLHSVDPPACHPSITSQDVTPLMCHPHGCHHPLTLWLVTPHDVTPHFLVTLLLLTCDPSDVSPPPSWCTAEKKNLVFVAKSLVCLSLHHTRKTQSMSSVLFCASFKRAFLLSALFRKDIFSNTQVESGAFYCMFDVMKIARFAHIVFEHLMAKRGGKVVIICTEWQHCSFVQKRTPSNYSQK